MFKFILPLTAAMKAGNRSADGCEFGRLVPQAYKGCKDDLSRPSR